MKISVLLVDDHTIVRESLRALLQHEEDVEIVGEAENGREALTLAKQLEPDIVLMDLSMPGLNGIEATRQFKQQLKKIKVIVLSGHDEDEYVTDLMENGASGYVL